MVQASESGINGGNRPAALTLHCFPAAGTAVMTCRPDEIANIHKKII